MHTSEPCRFHATSDRTEVALGFDGSENVVSALNWSLVTTEELGSGTEAHSSRLGSPRGHEVTCGREKGIKRNQQGRGLRYASVESLGLVVWL